MAYSSLATFCRLTLFEDSRFVELASRLVGRRRLWRGEFVHAAGSIRPRKVLGLDADLAFVPANTPLMQSWAERGH